MVALAVVDDVEDLVGVPGLGAVLDRGQVGRGVVEGAVALADDERRLGPLDEDDGRPLALDGEPLLLQVLDDLGEHRVVEALAELDVERHAQAVVDRLERPQAVGHELLPEGPVLGIAGVELGGLGPRGVLDGRVAGLDSILGQAIEPGQLADRVGREARLVAGVLPAPEDHAELRAPVAQVVVADDLVPERREDPRQAVADDGRAEVPDVHRLGDVGRREVDDDRLGDARGRDQAEPVVGQQVAAVPAAIQSSSSGR